MKCPDCGTENQETQNRCRNCGRPLVLTRSKSSGTTSAGAQKPITVFHPDVARRLKLEYSHASKDPADRNLDCIQQVCGYVTNPKTNSKELIDFIARMVFRQFHIKELAIGLRSASDGRFRYVTMQGMRANVWEEHNGLSYSEKQFFENETYKGTMISRQTKLLLAEDNPYDESEQKTYSEHLMKASSRKALDDSIEGDYLDILIFGTNNNLLGWIEISGTWDEKLPNVRSIKTIEIIATLTGIALSRDPAIAGT